MDRHEQIHNIKKLEADFINTIEGTIKDKYLSQLFTSYKKTIHGIAECYKNPAYSFSESKQCAQNLMTKYLTKEKSFEDLFNHYENGIVECLRLCKFDVKNPILDCYEKCFIGMKKEIV